MMMALASSGKKPAVLFPGASRCCRSRARMRERFKPSARASRRIRSRWSMPPRWAAAPALRLAAGASFWALRQPRRWLARRWGFAAAYRACALRAAHLAGCRAPLGPRHSAAASVQDGRRGYPDAAAIRNAMVVHAAFGGSTNLLLHISGHCPCGGLQRPTASDWVEVNRLVPRLVDALPNGPRNFATVQVFLAGGVPEVMLHLRAAGLLDTSVKTVSGETLDTCLDWWQQSPGAGNCGALARAGRNRSRRCDHVARSRAVARADVHGLFSPSAIWRRRDRSSRAPRSTPRWWDATMCLSACRSGRVFVTEEAAIQAIKSGEMARAM
jgi:hypothetical protein